jgi:hypothetical protein
MCLSLERMVEVRFFPKHFGMNIPLPELHLRIPLPLQGEA